MRIALLNTNGSYSHLLNYNGIKEAFEQIKSEDPTFDFAEINICQQDVEVPKYKPDYVFVASPLAAGFRVWTKYRNTKTIVYDQEGLYENLGVDSIPYSTFFATVDKFSYEWYKDHIAKKGINCKAYHMPLGFSPSVYKFVDVPENMKSDVCMAGVMFDRRREVCEWLHPLKDKIKLRVITAKDWWRRVIHQDSIQFFHKDVVSPEEMNKYYCGAKIIVCVNRDYSPANKLGLQSTTPGRVFQETACRRLVMIDDTRPEVNEYFEDGKEIVVFHGAEDLREKVTYYLSHDEEREAIAHNGYVRTMKENTWKVRLQGILKFVKESEV
jgi:spore maturation protein CgeB